MKIRDLGALLNELNVPPELYRLDGSHHELAFVIEHSDATWTVFLSERGTKSGAVKFDNEHDACIQLFGDLCRSLASRGQLKVENAAPPPDREVARP